MIEALIQGIGWGLWFGGIIAGFGIAIGVFELVRGFIAGVRTEMRRQRMAHFTSQLLKEKMALTDMILKREYPKPADVGINRNEKPTTLAPVRTGPTDEEISKGLNNKPNNKG